MIRIIYIHGFLSSPKSFKARVTQQWLLDLAKPSPSCSQLVRAEQEKSFNDVSIEFVCPQLSSYPGEALLQLEALCEIGDSAHTYLIGSSLGGFWASYLVEQKRAERAVLINPAVSPHQRFAGLVGTELKSYYSDEVYRFQDQDINVLASCESKALKDASRYWLMAQTGDEVLDYRDAQRRYNQCKKMIEKGGNHSFEGYEAYLPQILAFFIG